MVAIHSYVQDLQKALGAVAPAPVAEAIAILHQARLAEQRVFIMGNGGSASTASHLVCDFIKNSKHEGLPHFRVIGLADNMATLSAYANDEGYDSVFAQQLAAFVQPGDVVLAISTSGNSPNVLRAVELANAMDAITIGFTGFDGGRLAHLVKLNLHVDSYRIEHVEDVHLALGHLICAVLRDGVTAV